MYLETDGSCRVSGDIKIVLRKLAERDRMVLVVTPLLEDKNRLMNEEKSEKVYVRRVLEAQQALETGEIRPDVVVVQNYEIIKGAGTDAVLRKMWKGQVIYMNEESNQDLDRYPVFEEEKRKELFEVRAISEIEKFSVVFAVTKLKPVKKTCVVVRSKKEAEKLRIFLDAFGVGSEVDPGKMSEGKVGILSDNALLAHRYALVVDFTEEVESESAVVLRLGSQNSEEAKRFTRLLERAERYRYRVESVMRMITPMVLSGKKQIDPDVTKNLKGAFRME